MAEAPRPFYWSVLREIQENRFLYIAPLSIMALVTLGSLASIGSMAIHGRLPVAPLSMAPAPIMLASFIVGLFYSVDALYGERRDRSILFWKSMPVSDRGTVLAKASIPLVLLPLFAYLLSVTAQVILPTFSTPILLGRGLSPAALWEEFSFFQGLLIMPYGLAVHVLWFAPIYGWLILLSAWARRAPFLWAVLPPMALLAFEAMAFRTSYFGSMLRYRFWGAMSLAFGDTRGDVHRVSQLTPLPFLTSPGLWIGLLLCAAFLAATIRLRRQHEPI